MGETKEKWNLILPEYHNRSRIKTIEREQARSQYVVDEIKECFAVDMTCVQSNVKQALGADNWDRRGPLGEYRLLHLAQCPLKL